MAFFWIAFHQEKLSFGQTHYLQGRQIPFFVLETPEDVWY
jgi:hypothetical protein